MNLIPSSDIPFTAIDIETTGLHPFYSEIIEIGAVRFRLNGRVEGEFSELIDPLKPIPPRATEIHGITDDMVAGKRLWKVVAPEFYKFVSDSILVAHNAPFDLSFISFKGTVIALPFPDSFVVDTLTITRELYPTFERHTLADLSRTFGIKLNNAHRALADARACGQVMLQAFKRYDENWEKFAQDFIFHTAAWQTLDSIPSEMVPLIEACRNGCDIEITYVDSEGTETHRRITPLQLNRIRQVPYLFGHCHLRDAGRNFRLDRIKAWEIVQIENQ
jgi:DNA polymerase III epsilon subunit family exonuclease